MGGGTIQSWRSMFFLQSFVKSRPVETRKCQRVPFQMYHSKKLRRAAILDCRAKHDENKPWKLTHLEDSCINTITRVQVNQQRNFLTNRWWKIELNYVLIFISRSTARWLFLIVIGPNCSRESLQTAVQSPLGPTLSRLRVVPHFSSGIVEWAKRKRAWKSPQARKGDKIHVSEIINL